MSNGLKSHIVQFLLVLLFTTIVMPVAATTVDYRFTNLGKRDGLPSHNVQAITQQKSGYIWIATDNGLAKYDGSRFTYYQHNPGFDNHISNNMVNHITEDGHGNLWLITEDGLSRIDTNGQVKQYLDESIERVTDAVWLTSIYLDNSGQLWLGSPHGAYLYDATSETFVRFRYTNKAGVEEHIAIYHFAQTSNGNFYLATTHGLATIDKDNRKIVLIEGWDETSKAILSSHMDHLHITADDRLLLSPDGHHLYWYQLGSTKLTMLPLTSLKLKVSDPLGGYIDDSLELANGDIWLAHMFGISIVDTNGRFIQHISSKPLDPYSLADDYVIDLYQDQSGLIWAANNRGVSIYDPIRKASTLYQMTLSPGGLPSNDVRSIATDNNGRVWVATNAGIAEIKDNQVNELPNSELLANLDLWQIQYDQQQRIWFSSTYGVGYYDLGQQRIVYLDNHEYNKWGLSNSELFTVSPDKSGGAWITGYYGVGLTHVTPTKGVDKQFLVENSRYDEGFNFSFETVIANDGTVWMATTDNIYRVDPATGLHDYIMIEADQPFIRVTGLAEHANGDIWATTQGRGLVRITNIGPVNQSNYQVVAPNQTTESTPSSFQSILIDLDDENLVWLTSHDRLHSYNIVTDTFLTYASLIEPREVLFSEISLKQDANTLYLASGTGLYAVDKKLIKINQFKPTVAVTAVEGNGKQFSISDNSKNNRAQVDYSDNDLTFHFASFEFSAPERIQYRYRLVGADSTWHYSEKQTSVTYSNLGSGNYLWQVEATNSDGIWSPHRGEWHFTISTPWWVWAIAVLCGLIAIGLVYLFSHRSKRLKLLNDIAFTDPLTGLANRRQLTNWLDLNCLTPELPMLVVFIDLDDFKHINDSFGHDVGDEYIISIGNKLTSILRPNDRLARLGGDEFAIIINGTLRSGELQRIITRLMEALTANHHLQSHNIKGSASIGVARFPEDGLDSSSLLKNADTAMYAAKHMGKNTYCEYRFSDSQELQERFNIGSMIFHSIEQNQMLPYYQAKVCCETGEVKGVEALARWQHPEKGLISPDTFIPVAEANGAILKIGQQILRQACFDAKLWQDLGVLHGPVSVNVSARELNDPAFIDNVLDALTTSKLPASELELELTESLLVENIAVAKSRLKILQTYGIKISLDDFGTGFSSLNYLDELPLNTIKIDRSFTRKIDANKQTDVLAGILAMAEALDLEVVAEGVETFAQFEFLQRHHCHLVQGFLFSKPQDYQAFSNFLVEHANGESEARSLFAPYLSNNTISKIG